METEPRTEADAVADIVSDAHTTEVVEIRRGDQGAVQLLAVPSGRGSVELVDPKPHLDKYLAAPERREGTATLLDLDSFIRHVNRFKDDDSAIFGDPEPGSPSLTAVLDYHRAGSESAARFGRHRSVYHFPISEEWQAWASVEGTEFGTAALAEWLEDRIVDVLDPEKAGETPTALAEVLGVSLATPQRLLELSKGLEVRVDQRVVEKRNLSTGEAQLVFEQTHSNDVGQPLKIPGAFLVGIPVFRSGERYQLAIRLRYRVREGRVSWLLSRHRPDAILQDALTQAFEEARDQTELPLLVGRPE